MNKLKMSICLFFCMIPAFALAADKDKSAEIICSMSSVIECDEFKDCVESSSEEINIPRFIKIDLIGKTMSDASVKDGAKKSNIRTLIRQDGEIIMQGAENGRAFSVVVNEMSGKCTATISEDSFGFILFGSCMAL